MHNSSFNNFLSDGKIADAGSKTYNNLQLEDLPNEEWVDAFGYDGIYQVSSLGRVKSLQKRLIRGGNSKNCSRKILKQSIIKAENGRMNNLIVSLDKIKTLLNLFTNHFTPK